MWFSSAGIYYRQHVLCFAYNSIAMIITTRKQAVLREGRIQRSSRHDRSQHMHDCQVGGAEGWQEECYRGVDEGKDILHVCRHREGEG